MYKSDIISIEPTKLCYITIYLDSHFFHAFIMSMNVMAWEIISITILFHVDFIAYLKLTFQGFEFKIWNNHFMCQWFQKVNLMWHDQLSEVVIINLIWICDESSMDLYQVVILKTLMKPIIILSECLLVFYYFSFNKTRDLPLRKLNLEFILNCWVKWGKGYKCLSYYGFPNVTKTIHSKHELSYIIKKKKSNILICVCVCVFQTIWSWLC
jgi:hypothetical protein